MTGAARKQGEEHAPSLVVLTGFRATGKTAVGKILAGLLGYRFVDTDQEICARMGCTISESVDRHGWQYFRDCERQILLALAGAKRTVAATGGGSVLHRQAWQQLQNSGVVLWLRADVETIVSRLQADKNTAGQRPSLSGQALETEIPALLAEREPLYRAGSDMVLETTGQTPDELAAVIQQRLLKDSFK